MELPIDIDLLTAATWGAVVALLAYPIGGALMDAWREWRWNREQRRTMSYYAQGRDALRRGERSW